MVRRSTPEENDASWIPSPSLISDVDSAADDSEVEELIAQDSRRVTERRNVRSNNIQSRQRSQSISPADSVVGQLAIIGVGAALALSLLWVGVVAVGILYPMVQTLKSMDKRNREYERRWASYWVILACFFMVHWIPKLIVGWIPGYSVVLMSFLWWLARNDAENANYLYQQYVYPTFKRNEQAIDQTSAQALGQLERMGKMAVINMNAAIAPCAKKLEAATRKYHRQLSGGGRIRKSRWH